MLAVCVSRVRKLSKGTNMRLSLRRLWDSDTQNVRDCDGEMARHYHTVYHVVHSVIIDTRLKHIFVSTLFTLELLCFHLSFSTTGFCAKHGQSFVICTYKLVNYMFSIVPSNVPTHSSCGNLCISTEGPGLQSSLWIAVVHLAPICLLYRSFWFSCWICWETWSHNSSSSF